MEQTIHGNLIVVNGVGTLILGDAGSGKTLVCLELAMRGHFFIADDSVLIETIGQKLMGRASPVIGGRMNVRGEGISEIPNRFGFKSSCEIAFIVELRDGERQCDSSVLPFGWAHGQDELLNLPRVGLFRHTSTLADSIEEKIREWRLDENTIRTFRH